MTPSAVLMQSDKERPAPFVVAVGYGADKIIDTAVLVMASGLTRVQALQDG